MRLLLSLIFALSLLAAPNQTVFAAVDPGEGGGGSGGSSSTNSAPNISDIADPLIRLFNILTLAGGIVFMMMIFYSAYKYSLAQGDPKGIVGAKETLTHAVFGFIVTVGAFAIINIISNIFGLNTGILSNPSKASKSAIQELCKELQLDSCD